MKYRILVTSLGTATAVAAIKTLRRYSAGHEFYIIGTDINPASHLAGIAFCDKFVQVPLYNDPSYLEVMAGLCLSYDIEYLLPVHDLEVACLAQNREVFNKTKICSPDAEQVEFCNDKLLTFKKLRLAEIVCPSVWQLPAINDSQQPTFPWFVKPRRGVGSTNCFRVNSKDELAFVLRRVAEPIAQEVLHGEHYVLDVLNDLSGKTKVVVPRREYTSKAGVGTNVRIIRDPQLEDFGVRVAEALKLKGPANIELFRDENKLYLIEVNPRLSAGHIFTAMAGVNLPLLTLKVFGGEKIGGNELLWRDGFNINRYWEEATADGA